MANRISIDWKGWGSWVAASAVGAGLVVAIIYGCDSLFKFSSDNDSLAGTAVELLAFGIAGTVFAAMQRMWLRRRMWKAGWWITATVASWYVALGSFAGLNKLDQLPSHPFAGKFGVAVRISLICFLVVTVSLPQWFLLRRRFFGAGYWLTARPLGLLAGLGMVLLADGRGVMQIPILTSPEVFGLDVPNIVAWSFGGVLFGTGFGAITGAAMVWILRKPKGVAGGPASKF